MPAGLSKTRALVRRTAVRAWFVESAERAVGGTLAGALVGLIAVGVDRFVPLGIEWWVMLPVCVVVGAVLGGLTALPRRWSALRAAHELDDRHGLGDQLASALALTSVSPDDPFVVLAVTNAERLSASVRYTSVRELAPRRWWWGVPVLIAAGVGIGVLVPQRDIGREESRVGVDQGRRDVVRQEIRQLVEATRELASETSGQPASEEALRAVEELQRELARQGADPSESASRASQVTERVAEGLETGARERLAQSDAVRGAASRAAHELATSKNQGEDRPGVEDAFTRASRAIGSGDMAEAASQVRHLAEKAESMSSERREGLARDLEELARKLDTRRASSTQGEQNSAPDEGAETPRESERAADSITPSVGRGKTIPSGKSGADRNAGRPEKAEGNEPKAGDGPRSIDELRRSLDSAAQELRRAQQDGTEKGAHKSDQRDAKATPSEGREGTPPKAGTKKRESAGQPSDGKSQASDAEARAQQEEDKGSTPADTRARDGSSASDRRQEQSTGDSTTPEGERSGTASAGNSDKGGSRPGGVVSSPELEAEKRTDGRESNAGKPESGSGDTPGEERGGGTRALKELAERFEKIGRAPDLSKMDAERAKQLREQAKQLLEKASPEERGKLERIARDLQRQAEASDPRGRDVEQLQDQPGEGTHADDGRPGTSGGHSVASGQGESGGASADPPGANANSESGARSGSVAGGRRPSVGSDASKTELIDARPRDGSIPNGPATVISQWRGPRQEGGSPGGATGGGASAIGESFRSAAAGAERAVEQQAVPSRYGDFVKRVFRRYVGRTSAVPGSVQPGSMQQVPLSVPDAKDVARPPEGGGK